MEKQVTYQIPLVNMPWFQGRVQELNKKAVKLGTDPITFEVLRTWTKKTKDSEGRPYEKIMNQVSISGIAPKLDGWSFLGTIQHTDNGNILRAIKEVTIPVEYRNVKRACDHCNKDRNRKDTYLVVNESNEFKQLGKACLKDYTGHISPAFLAAMAEFIDQLNQSDDKDYESNGKFDLVVDSRTFLRFVCEAVVSNGAYVTRNQSQLAKAFASSDLAWMSIFPPRMGSSSFVPLTTTVAGESLFNKVVATLSELETRNNINSFEHNVLMAWKKETVSSREIGLLGAAVLIYEKDLLKKIDLKKDQESGWVGTTGERSDFQVTITKKFTFDTAFGFMTMVMMKDSDGNILMWKTGTGTSHLSTGDVIKIKGTVKKHDTYQSVKQTILTRVVILEEKDEKEVVNG